MNPFGYGWKKYIPLFGLIPTLVFFLVINFLPSLATFAYSFTNYTGIRGHEWHVIGLQNYREFFTASNSRDKWDALKKTIEFSLSVTVIQNVIAIFLALILNSRIKGYVFYRSVIFLPVILGVTVVGLAWTLVFNPIFGPAEHLLNLFGGNSAFFGDVHLAFPLVIGVQIWMAMGFSVLIYLAGLQAIPVDLYESGYIDGATSWQSFRHITYPLLAPTVTVNVLLAIIGSLQTFDVIYVLTGGEHETTTLGMLIFQTAFGGAQGNLVQQNQGYASALMVVMFFLVLFVTLVMQYYLRKREVQT